MLLVPVDFLCHMKTLVGQEDKKLTHVKMQYNTVGRDRKGSITSVHSVANWFSSLKRTPKKNKSPAKTSLASRSDWNLSTLSSKSFCNGVVGFFLAIINYINDSSNIFLLLDNLSPEHVQNELSKIILYLVISTLNV